ncbi:helix-turn-helix transcriptional regulator [Bosea sp. (in: a-proteobacteria)]|uniref:helix-turn-helix transcriptional regulator n=1 Tax=Bosea sp. (in: a-proteobacteria) TaxID=1871050 RepID=UPI0026278FD0|nr:helix-turn-helix transcriptional regulator [Bosea sp. (in: a-proteobacteria)]MCO5092698.1 helix-turn-helix transcriptional regulator [Bosea sp. (in: a-proteobacteria)]
MAYEALLHEIYAALADPNQWPRTLIRISDYLGCLGGQLIYNPPPGGNGMMVVGRLDPVLTDVYLKNYTQNPWTSTMAKQPFEQAVAISSLVERKVVQRTAFHADVLLPQGITDMLAISHRSLSFGGGVGGVGFALSARAESRIEHMRKQLARLAPHINRAVDATLHLGALADGSRQLTKVLELLPNPAFLLDGRGGVVHANSPAETLLRSGSGLVYANGERPQLTAEIPSERSALARLLASALAVATGKGGEPGEPLRLSRSSGEAPLVVIPVPLPPPAFALWEAVSFARVLVMVIDPTIRHVAAISVLQATFGLTKAEARVASLIGSGLSGPQAAQALGISPLTTKTHLTHCFEKMNIRSQNELTRILLSLPSAHQVNGDTKP